jgi:hypothetical protein
MPHVRTLAAALLTLVIATPASAQLFEVTRTTGPTGVSFELDAAYDPVHDCYFVVSSDGTGVIGRFLNRSGTTLGTVTLDTRRARFFTRAAYSPDLPDGTGGTGAFLVIWNVNAVTGLLARRVVFPGVAVGPIVTIPLNRTGFPTKADIAYSPLHKVFLVGLGWSATTLIRVGLDLQALNYATLIDPSNSCPNFEFPLACDEVHVVWNPTSGEFGVLYNQDRTRYLARVSGAGAIAGRTLVSNQELYGALSIDLTTGNYLAVTGGTGGSVGGTPARTEGAVVAPDGTLLASGLITTTLDNNISVAAIIQLQYLPASETFLLIGRAFSGGGLALELNRHGVLQGSTLALSHPAVVVSHPTAPEWMVSTPVATSIISTLTRFGGSDARLSRTDCLTPDPFVALGGGTCYNGGWLPPGIPAPSAPVIVPGGCTSPDPFAALGGGTCVNGGWLPPGIAAPAPPPAPQPPPVGSGGCSTPDPFVALGGGTCVNGGWLPPGIAAPAPPPVIPGGCTTPDPFVAIGGGVCANGGWRPRGH